MGLDQDLGGRDWADSKRAHSSIATNREAASVLISRAEFSDERVVNNARTTANSAGNKGEGKTH